MLQLAVDREAAEDGGEFGGWTGFRIPDNRGMWHPLVARLYDYWLAVTPPGRLPGREHIVPEDIAPLWSRLWLLDVVRRPLRYRYRYCGGELVRSLGSEVTGRWLDEVEPQLSADPEPRERLCFTALTGRPTWWRGPAHGRHGLDHRTVESCIVPLAGDGTTVDKMIGITVAFDRKGCRV
jgi:hypothetical protein